MVFSRACTSPLVYIHRTSPLAMLWLYCGFIVAILQIYWVQCTIEAAYRRYVQQAFCVAVYVYYIHCNTKSLYCNTCRLTLIQANKLCRHRQSLPIIRVRLELNSSFQLKWYLFEVASLRLHSLDYPLLQVCRVSEYDAIVIEQLLIPYTGIVSGED